MAVRDVIERDEDRVFAVDTECFIIFTGESVRDNRPFIRIGNWLNLPVEIIPLIENIIITDTMAGNPSHEQFNIDIKYLPTNRYIGSHLIVERFLDYQRIFGLDLHSASVVDAEKDIPEISRKNVSDRESFIGIFYRDSNFKITHGGKELFNLMTLCDNQSNDNRTHDRLANLSKQKRYSGAGFAIIENNPVFYRANNLVAYLFPHSYYESFFRLGINPRNISTVIHPSENYLGMGRFLKWKHSHDGKLVFCCDNTEETSLMQKLFSRMKLQIQPFTGMNIQPSTGFAVHAIPHSYNLAVDIDIPSTKKKLRIAYIKGSSELKNIAKDKFDLFLINYSVYEDAVVALKALKTPVAVIDDGNQSVSRVPLLDTPVIRQNMQYEFIRLADESEFLEYANALVDDDAINKIIGGDASFIESSCREGIDTALGDDRTAGYFNLLSFLKFINDTTSDRKIASLLKNLLRSGFSSKSRGAVYNQPGLYRVDIVLMNGSVYEFASEIAEPVTDQNFLFDAIHSSSTLDHILSDKDEKELYSRIENDRKRLDELLKLFLENPSFRKEVKSLKEAMEKRKRLFLQERKDHPVISQGFISKLRETTADGRTVLQAEKKGNFISRIFCERDNQKSSARHGGKLTLSKKKISAAMLVVLILLGILAYSSRKGYKTHTAEQIKAETEKNEAQKKEIFAKYQVNINEGEIFIYANQTASKNGYTPIDSRDFGNKNPHWIYPGNVFILPDGEKIIVKDRDTLWNIARIKLEKRHLEFYKSFERIKKVMESGKTPEKADIDHLREFSSNDEQRKIVDEFVKNTLK
jgi:hypothetical protein